MAELDLKRQTALGGVAAGQLAITTHTVRNKKNHPRVARVFSH